MKAGKKKGGITSNAWIASLEFEVLQLGQDFKEDSREWLELNRARLAPEQRRNVTIHIRVCIF